MEITGFNDNIISSNVLGLSKCFLAYSQDCNKEKIQAVGFNEDGDAYIAFESGICIISKSNDEVQYVTFIDPSKFFKYYDDALLFLEMDYIESCKP